jgi:hypothetical protein
MVARYHVKSAAFAAFLCALVAAPALADAITLPAISDPATGEYHTGKVVLVELVTPDLAASERFYGKLFGWQFSDTNSKTNHYAEATLNGHPVAGLIHRDLAQNEQHRPARSRRNPAFWP